MNASSAQEPNKIDAGGQVYSVAFHNDGAQVLGGGTKAKIQRWRVKDGVEEGTSMDAGSSILDIAVSDQWVVSGTCDGQVTVWEGEEQRIKFAGHDDYVNAVDVSPDGTKIATGSDDRTACIWALSTGERLVGPLKHDSYVVAVRFSPDGRLLATAAIQKHDSVRIYSGNGRILVDVEIRVSFTNRSLAWARDGTQLFVLSSNGKISCLDASTGTVISQWPIHSSNEPRCIELASNGTFIAATARSSISFWDTTTHEQIGSVIDDAHEIKSLAISAKYDMVTAGDERITIRNLSSFLPSSYRESREFDVVNINESDSRETSVPAQDACSDDCESDDEIPDGDSFHGNKAPSNQCAIEIVGRDDIYAVAFLVDGKHVLSGGDERTIRRRRVDDGERVGSRINTGSSIRSIAISQDAKWIVNGTINGRVTVWDATSYQRVAELNGHGGNSVCAVDISSDGTKVAIGSDDTTASVWSFLTGWRLLWSVKHRSELAAVKFSPDGHLLATATWGRDSVLIYRHGRLVVDFPIRVSSPYNQSLAWEASGKRLFALCKEGNIHCFDALSGSILSKWPIHSSYEPYSIVLSRNGAFIAASANSSVSFWDTTRHEQIGSLIGHSHDVDVMAISTRYNLVAGGNKTISIHDLCDVLPSPYCDDMLREREIESKKVEKVDPEDTVRHLLTQDGPDLNETIVNLEKTIQDLQNKLSSFQAAGDGQNQAIDYLLADLQARDETIECLQTDLRARNERSDNKVDRLNKTVQKFHVELANARRTADQEKDSRDRIIKSLRTDLETWKTNAAVLENGVQGLRSQLASSQDAAMRERENFNQTVDSLHAELQKQGESASHEIAQLNQTVQGLHTKLADSESVVGQQKDSFNEVIISLRADLHERDTNAARLQDTIKVLDDQVITLQKETEDEREELNETIYTLRAEIQQLDARANGKIALLEQTNQKLSTQLVDAQRETDSLVQEIRVHEEKHQCETLYAQDRVYEATESLLKITNTVNEDSGANKVIIDWAAEFTHRCRLKLERVGDDASGAEKGEEALRAYSTALSLTHLAPNALVIKWVRATLIRGTRRDALSAAAKFKLPEFRIYQAICDIYEQDDRVTEAIECYQQMQIELKEDLNMKDERMQWELDFRGRCVQRFEQLGDSAMESLSYDVAIEHYSNALTREPAGISHILIKCCQARAGLLTRMLDDATEFVARNPSSYVGYKRKHAVLHCMGRYGEAFKEFGMMLSVIEKSLDPSIRELRHQYVDITSIIRVVVEKAISDIPHVLIDLANGRLCDKTDQAAAFEELAIYDKLRSSMITNDQVDRERIETEVEMFYEYVMLSHRWQPSEPSFQMLQTEPVYALPASPMNNKLLNFCVLVRFLCFRWAWSDTCCVNQSDKSVQQESVVAMFRWYRNAALTIVHLFGVLSERQEAGSLLRSIWNTRGWTFQEYVASRVVQFYTEDWKPYLGLEMFNHKESPMVVAEMEQAMSFTTEDLDTLQPGLDRVREKLYLAARRQTTRQEDIAYSLFGIFNVVLPVIYGEGIQAVGRLLENILTRSDNVTLLAWTGKSGTQHTYLPVDLTVYDKIDPPHVPQPIEETEMDRTVANLQSSLPDLTLAVDLYNQLYDLPPLTLVAGRLKLPGIGFPVTGLRTLKSSSRHSSVYHATSPLLGDVEIKTTDNLAVQRGLLLIHPWIGPLLDMDFASNTSQVDLSTRALRLIAWLRQPFGALLLASRGRVQFSRVATDSLIMVQIREETSLKDLMDGIRTVDVQ